MLLFVLIIMLCTMCEADQHIYVLGGSDPRNLPLGKVAMYTADSGNGSWSSIKAMGEIRYGGRAAGIGGFLYHVGGSNGAEYPYLNSTLRYSPHSDEWQKVADIPCDPQDPGFCPDSVGDDPAGGGVADHAVVSLQSFLYVVGGTNGTVSLKSTERYDPKTDTWKYMASMEIGRCYVAAAILNGKIYAVGGSATPAGPGGPGGGPGALTSVETYDPTTDKWEVLPSKTNVARSSHAVAVAGGMLYAVGGEDGGANPVSYDSVERYDPTADTWTMMSSMNVPRCQVGAGVISGILFAVGGYNDRTQVGWTSSVEKYDAKSDSWRMVAPFPLERQYIGVAVL